MFCYIVKETEAGYPQGVTPVSDASEGGGDIAGNYLAAWREYRGLTQAFVEKRNKWRSSRLSNLELGHQRCTIAVLEALAATYDVSRSDLLRPPPSGGPRISLKGRTIGYAGVPPTGTLNAFGKMAEAQASLRQLATNLETIRAQLDRSAQDLKTAELKMSEAMADNTILADMFESYARQLREAGVSPSKEEQPSETPMAPEEIC